MGAMKSLLALNADRADELWIGLQHGGPERWHWSLADEDFYQEGERDYRNFVGMDNTGHFIKHESGKWYPVDNINSYFMCYDGKENIHS